ncbi:YdeI/OmpD-associated family protein [Streptomyces sp. NPDC051940]|uniref:YdeI/OmpD-associated family protein n=1 Tax=Streptomyces sp. NPDC051940 TaxID=3155675 RepID=UPI0034290334
METLDGLEIRFFDGPDALEAWLDAHHGRSDGIWVKIAKKSSGIPSVQPDTMLDVYLCFGWITGQRRPLDDVHYLQKLTPRRPRSQWSKVNVARVEVLTAAGRMREAGLAEVRAAQADGRWEAAYESQANATVPPDLAAALAADDRARAFFDSLNRTERYAVIVRLLRSRTPAARQKELERAVARLAAGDKGPRS